MPRGLISGSRIVTADIALLADIRVGDVAAPCHAAAARALIDAGYSVVVVPVLADAIAADPYRIDPDMRTLLRDGRLRRVSPAATVECSLALAFDARILAGLEGGPEIRAGHRIVTVERPAGLTDLPRRELDRFRARAELALGGPITWCPTSILARDALLQAVPDWNLTERDWAPVAPDLSHVRPDAEERARPAIGRARIARSRPSGDWPASLVTSPLVALRERADPHGPDLSWPQAAPSEIWPDRAVSLADFLRKVDFLANPDVARDDPLPVEALMALSAGVVPCLPESYRDLFGNAAIYGSGSDLAKAVIGLKMDPDLMVSVRQGGAALLREVFAPDFLLAHVESLIGAPGKAVFAPIIHAEPPARILFYSTNGVGMGHLTRQLAVARRLPERLQPIFVSHSRAVDIVRQFGFVGEHLPYHATYGEARAHWNVGLARTLDAAFAFYRPRAVVFDGNVPFKGFLAAIADHPGMATVWIRRAMWGPGRDLEALDRAAAFDLVVEPGEPAWARDDGPTAAAEAQVRRVPPVRILDQAEIPCRADACAALGLDPSRTNVLIATGAGNNFDMAGIIGRVIDQLMRLPELGLAVAEWQIAEARPDLPSSVVRLTGYPFAQYLSAFDAAIAAPGYNTFCEHLASGLPTLWLPNENAQMDRQIERARFAVDNGVGRLLRREAPFAVAEALAGLLDPDSRATMAERGARLASLSLSRNGASVIADMLTDLAATSISRSRPSSISVERSVAG